MQNSSPALPFCSASSPLHSAGKSTMNYYDIRNSLPPVQEVVNCNPVPFQVMNPGVQVVVLLVLVNSMRCQELLNICVGDEIKPSLFLVHGLKRSYSYAISIPISPANRAALGGMNAQERLFPYTYHFVWRSMCRAGLGLSVVTRVNRVVTHRGRYDLAEKLNELNERSEITPLLHHKSKRSKQHYLGVLPK